MGANIPIIYEDLICAVCMSPWKLIVLTRELQLSWDTSSFFSTIQRQKLTEAKTWQ